MVFSSFTEFTCNMALTNEHMKNTVRQIIFTNDFQLCVPMNYAFTTDDSKTRISSKVVTKYTELCHCCEQALTYEQKAAETHIYCGRLID